MKEPLEQMFAAAKADGIELVARSAYRSTQEQTTLFNSMKQDYINQGMSEEEAFDGHQAVAQRAGHLGA